MAFDISVNEAGELVEACFDPSNTTPEYSRIAKNGVDFRECFHWPSEAAVAQPDDSRGV
jgi:hypothetical protein